MLFQNICSDASRVQGCWNLAKTQDEKDMPCAEKLHTVWSVALES